MTAVDIIQTYAKLSLKRYHNLHIYGKAFIWLLSLFYISTSIFIFIVTPARIAQYSYDKARLLAATPFGWLVLGVAIVCISFPPLTGFTTLITLAGFAYGMQGFFISAVASVFGSAMVFVILRRLFSHKLHAWSSQSEKWQALEAVIKAKGLPLIILIRLSPFPPWVYANSLFASIETVKLWQFVTATLFLFPKILLHTFIGSKAAALADGDQRGHMDPHTKLLNSLLIGGSIVIAIGTGWWVYILVQRHIRDLEGFSTAIDESAARAVEDFDEEAPLLSTTQAHGS